MATIEKRTTDDGGTAYRVKVRLKGHPPQNATFTRLTDARKWAQSTEAAMREGRHFKTAEAKRHTVADLIDRYLRDVMPAKGAKDRLMQPAQLERWRAELGHRLLSDLTPATIVEVRDKLARDVTVRGAVRSPGSVSRFLSVFSHAITVAVNEWGWLEDSPMRKVGKPKLPGGRVRFLSDEEREVLLIACRGSVSGFLYPAVALALATGMRRGEVLGLYWREPKNPPGDGSAWGVVSLEQARVILHQTKNGDRRTIPLAGPAVAALRELAKVRRLDTDLVFPGHDPATPVDLRTPWETALKRAGIENFRFHDLRHTTASYLAMNGATSGEIAAVLGHKTLAMVKRYAHLSDSHVAGVLERMNSKVFGK